MKSTNLTLTKLLSAAIFLMLVLNLGCKKVDEALDYALNFDGLFANVNGSEVELHMETAKFGIGKFTKIGTGMGVTVVGDNFCSQMERVNENTWKGTVMERSGGLFNLNTYGEISLTDNGNLLTVSPNGGANYTYTRVGGSNSGGGGTGSSTEVIVNQCISGSVGDKKIININVPANVIRMEVRTVEEAGTCDRNAADLFVRKGSNPVINSTTPYNWTSDYSSIQPNRTDEACIINNPGQGSWSIMLFGYNTFFISKLKVTLFK